MAVGLPISITVTTRQWREMLDDLARTEAVATYSPETFNTMESVDYLLVMSKVTTAHVLIFALDYCPVSWNPQLYYTQHQIGVCRNLYLLT